MYFDLYVPWSQQVADVQQTLGFLQELGYNVVALTNTISGKLPADLSCPIPSKLPFEAPSNLRILRRCTLVLSDSAQNHRVQLLSSKYNILAIRPTNEKALQQACHSLECDVISIDLTQRFEFYFKMKMLAAAIERGIKFEICYGPAVATLDSNARRNLISNATQLIRATRGRGLILSSEAHGATACRGPADVINLAAVWGLGTEKGTEAVGKLPRSVMVTARLKRTSFRGVVDVIYTGEKPSAEAIGAQSGVANKRKAGDSKTHKGELLEQKISKRQLKRQRKENEAVKEPKASKSVLSTDLT